MENLWFGLVICALFSGTQGFLKDEDYEKLPPLYTLDDLNHCRKIQGKFCKVKVIFRPTNSVDPSPVWKLIEETDKESYYFDHSISLRASCFPNGPASDVPKLEQDLKLNYSSDGLLPKVNVIRCSRDNDQIRITDFLPIIIGFILIILTVWSTYSDVTNKTSLKKNKSLMAFSFRANWTNVTTSKKKFVFVEGLRTCTMLCVVVVHSFALYVALYIENPVFIEKLLSQPIILAWFSLSNFFVQTFFVLSAMFLGRHILDLFQANQKFTFNDVILMIFNRYLRLIPQQSLLVFGSTTNLGPLLGNGLVQDFIENEVDICRKNWPWALFFLNNISPKIKMCFPLSWYLAVDFQMYVVVTVLCYICLKYRMNLYKTLGSLSVFILIANAVWNYANDYPITTLISPRSFLMANQLRDPMFLNLYMSTYSNAAAYIFATCFGFATITYSKTKILDKNINYYVWLLISCGLPCLALYLSRLSIKEPITVSMLSAIIKPIYALGFCLLITGMMVKPNTKFHKLFTWEPLVLFGNFTYSIYMFHFAGIVGKWARMTKPLYLTNLSMIQNMIIDIISCFLVGGFMFFVIEKPFANLQNIHIPRTKKKNLSKERNARTPPSSNRTSTFKFIINSFR